MITLNITNFIDSDDRGTWCTLEGSASCLNRMQNKLNPGSSHKLIKENQHDELLCERLLYKDIGYLIALDNYITQIAALASGICTVTNTELVLPSL